MKRLLLLLVIACTERDVPRPQPPPPPTPRDAAPLVDAAPLAFTGVLTAAESVDIASRVAALISSVSVGVGDKVEEGQVVAEMDPAQLKEELRGAEAALSAAAAASKQASVDVEDARRKLKLETKAVAAGVSPTQNLEEARLSVKRAEAALQRARSAQAAEAARTQTARDHVGNASLRAPFAGTVAMRYRDAGNRVEAGAPIVRIVGHGSMRLRFAIPPQLAKDMKVGTRVSATVDTVEKPIEATIKQVSPTIDPPSGMVIVEAELAAAGDSLQPGLAATVLP
jgi:RND family efflux transporter MFP subunit